MSVLILRPNSDSSCAQEIPSGTSRYTLVDEATKDEADYTYVSAGIARNTPQLDIYGFPDHTTESGTINSVTVKAYAKHILTGTCTDNAHIDPSVKIGSTVYASGQQNLTDSTALYSYAWTTNPATTAAWSWTEIDALLAGDYLTMGWVDKNNKRACYKYQLWVEVYYGEAAAGSLPLKNVFGRPFSGVFR